MWKFYAFFIVVIGFYLSQVDAQSCPDCRYGIAVTDGTTVVKRFETSVADAAAEQSRLSSSGFGFSAMTGTAACGANVCGSAGTETCTVNSGDSNVFECGCNAQWESVQTNVSHTCVDLNECANSTLNNCSVSGGVCTNISPGFTCACDAQYTGDGVNCTDFDECTASAHNCSGNATCTNAAPGFTCACNAQFTGDGYTCTDIDECTLGTHNCNSAATCSNLDPGFACTCNAQYTGNGVNCTDINECTSATHNCSPNGYCTNTAPGFTCTCNAQFTGNGVNCTDLDECSNSTFNNCSMYANCTNLTPGFSCACQAGYTGDGINCTDISECASNPCDPNANCTEPVANSHVCTCNTGYTGNGTSCTDVDECPPTAATSPCHANATCSNSPGSYSCACNAGFTGDGLNCTENNECLSNPCNVNADCTDLVNNYTCVCKSGYQGDGVTLCEKLRTNITISFFITCNNQVWDTDLQTAGSGIHTNITGLIQPAIQTFITTVDASAGILSVAYNFTNSTDGMGVAQTAVSLTISNTNIDDVEFLKRVNTIAETTQCGAVASADECALGIDDCGTDATCADSDYGFCCLYSYDYRFEVKYNVTFIPAYSNVSSSQSDELYTDAEDICTTALNNIQTRGCPVTLSYERESIEQGSSIGVILMRVVNGTRQAVDIAAELAKVAGTTTNFGTVISAGDYDECARNYTADRNCSSFATCLNFAGGFTCECNNTYYDNGTTTTGEFCITPITIDCNGTTAQISVLTDYYAAKNVSLDSLHLADESCNRTTHANLVGNSIEFTFSLNDCNTTLSQSTDNTTIIASNFISNVPSTGFFTGFAINVPFQCNLPSSINAIANFSSSVATIDFPSSGSSGGATVTLNAYVGSDYSVPLVPGQVLSTSDTVGLEAVVADLTGVSVMFSSLYAVDVTGTHRADLIVNGCAQNTIPNFNIDANGVGPARCSFQSFTFVGAEQVQVHATAILCTPTCAASCSSRRRRDVREQRVEGSQSVELSITITVRPDSNNTMIIDGIVFNDDKKDEPSSNIHDITLPIVAAILAFVLIILLALAVVVVVRKQRYTNKAYDVSHINMHAIEVKPPKYE